MATSASRDLSDRTGLIISRQREKYSSVTLKVIHLVLTLNRSDLIEKKEPEETRAHFTLILPLSLPPSLSLFYSFKRDGERILSTFYSQVLKFYSYPYPCFPEDVLRLLSVAFYSDTSWNTHFVSHAFSSFFLSPSSYSIFFPFLLPSLPHSPPPISGSSSSYKALFLDTRREGEEEIK